MPAMLTLPPLSLYIHIPWCVQKCPYCDFNSHGLKNKGTQSIPESAYIQHVLDDLKQDLKYVQNRKLYSIFIGGGTPSLLSQAAMKTLLDGVQALIPFESDIEITMEANPGTLETEKFQGFQQAGITRMSLGVQSFQEQKLSALGRIHDKQQAIDAAKWVNQIGLNSFNLDLMHGLPNQSIDDALSDLQHAIDLAPPHLSWYQLTLEPNTLFYSQPPVLPKDDTLWDIQERGHALLLANGYEQYEVSAYSKPDYQCKHNLNYWQFGDYLGIGCGAHGKITLPQQNKIIRTSKVKHPKGYMDLTKPYLYEQQEIAESDRPFEFFLNRFRLFSPCDLNQFEQYTGLPSSHVSSILEQAQTKQLITVNNNIVTLTQQGRWHLNTLLALFM
ncbi:radical SAM family heme chaperone HemW [Flocculibacter collagenilyticus]|uniref:radical SAM family heme chaperone HemW n=1 Tax=Flocculibacter collagenilyticus TaxID=2744479 RepID=UPI0018F52706|nr:radical SAM family heme chaperone HemW [Flocculibacter collagenilyticus]